jgi:hypothetical protein
LLFIGVRIRLVALQFVLKLSILLYRSDTSLDLAKVKTMLSTIYDIRSAISHGNVVKQKSDELRAMIIELYDSVKIVFTAYVNDFRFVEFLKAN